MARALLKFANLGPAMHSFAIQCANWICNRLPQAIRGNLSPYFILRRMAAPLGYLRSFGCLVRLTLPLALRSGDRHFTDRGVLGLYLGPSEQSPGSVVYVPSLRKLFVSREIVAYEDVHPGVKHIESHWPRLEDSYLPPDVTPQQVENVTFSGPMLLESPEEDAPLDALDEDEGSSFQPNAAFQEQSSSRGPPVATASNYDPTEDPSSKRFRRVLPSRSTRYPGAYFVDPTTASRV